MVHRLTDKPRYIFLLQVVQSSMRHKIRYNLLPSHQMSLNNIGNNFLSSFVLMIVIGYKNPYLGRNFIKLDWSVRDSG